MYDLCGVYKVGDCDSRPAHKVLVQAHLIIRKEVREAASAWTLTYFQTPLVITWSSLDLSPLRKPMFSRQDPKLIIDTGDFSRSRISTPVYLGRFVWHIINELPLLQFCLMAIVRRELPQPRLVIFGAVHIVTR